MVYRLEQGMLIDIHESSNTYGILFAFAPTLENLEIERCVFLRCQRQAKRLTAK